MELNSILKINNKTIFIDSCVLFYLEEDDGQTRKLIDSLKKNNKIYISAISGFELLKNRQRNKKEKSYLEILNEFKCVRIDKKIMMNAATLVYLYQKIGKINNSEGAKAGIDRKDKLTGDLIIGGTALRQKKSLLLTANIKDFPEHFWKKISEKNITIKSKEINLYFLEFNEEVFNDYPEIKKSESLFFLN